MKYAFLLTGGNAAGKTTAVEKALQPWHTAKDVYAGGKIMNIRADNDGRFKGDAQDQRRVLTEIWLSDVPVLMVEGTRINTPLMDVAKANPKEREFVVLMALQKPDVMRAHLVARCAKKNKTFRSEYWTYVKLEYEGMKRYPNSFRKNGIEPIRYTIGEDYAEQQQIVDYLQTRFTEILG